MKHLITFILLTLAQALYCQDYETIFSPKLQHTFGKLIKIHGQYPPNEAANVVELDLNWTLLGERYWHSQYKNLEFGVALSAAGFGNDSTLGQAFGVTPYMILKVPLGERSFLAGRMGFGMAAFNRPFDQIENPDNLVIGSTLNATGLFNAFFETQLNDRWSLMAGVNGWHYSNIHIKVPNIGANVLGVNLGLKYHTKGQVEVSAREPVTLADHRQLRIGLSGSLGLQAFRGTIRPSGGPVYPVYAGAFFARWPSSPNRRGFWNCGILVNYFTSSYDFILSQSLDIESDKARINSATGAVFGAHEWMFGHFAFELMVGLNVYDPFTPIFNDMPTTAETRTGITRISTNRIGFGYYPQWTENRKHGQMMKIGCGVRSAGGTADFLEFMMGYIF